jgi:uncharacterized protein YyaL (SSP411 family)
MSNLLAQETSPYLLQHADNPVAWRPWNAAALEAARRDDKPILLSIGYSACHWCHVMAHESFEDPATAAVMNELFVTIKVDREERPDLDKIYQLSHQILTGRGGGWPLTVFLTPQDLVPYFAGTYFPNAPRYGMPAFTEVLRQVAAFYHQQRDDITEQHGRLLQILQQVSATAVDNSPFDAAPLDVARNQLATSYDADHGGFGGAPKFPHPTHVERLLHHWAATATAGHPDQGALDMARTTLIKMADGGIYDQLGGGFCRYAVDEQWMIPHFEKMLYDNGPLLALYAQAWRISGDELFRRVAGETAEWVMREMQAPDGGYYATLDADSEGEEGKFYAWHREEVRALLDGEDYALFARRFGLDREPNFEHHWHLHVFHDLRELSEDFSLPIAMVESHLAAARRRLFDVRQERVHPGRDDKILTSWNGLMIKGMAVAGEVLGEAAYLDSAERALDFIHTNLWHDGRLLAVYKDGRARFLAYLDDYAFLIDGILALLQARWRDGDLDFAVELAEALLSHFQDRNHGGFFFTADDHEQLIHRPKPLTDEATPSGNGIAATVLGRLGHMLGESRYLEAAERTLRGAWGAVTNLPYAHDSLLSALEDQLYPPQLIVLRGTPDGLREWQARVKRHYAPRRIALAIPNDATDLRGTLAHCTPRGAVCAYVCSGTHCSAPITELNELERHLNTTEVSA